MASWSSFFFSYARRSRTIGLAVTLALGGVALTAPGGCTLNTEGLPAGGSSATAATTTTTSTLTTTSTTTTTSTGVVGCVNDGDCGAAVKGGCKKKVCLSSMCTEITDPANTPDTDNNACTSEACTGDGMPYHPAIQAGMKCEGMTGVCDGTGACVECMSNGDCTTGTTPSCNTATKTCGSCADGMKNGAEAGTDCGGTCKACNGDTCSGTGDCLSGKCVDKVCCDTACSGTCKACNVPGSVGTCTSAPAEQLDPLCNALVCDGAGACKTAAGAPCSVDANCASGVCIATTCRIPTNSSAKCKEDAVCASGLCTNSVCIACGADSQCKSGECAAPTCKAPGGAICLTDPECAGGSCQSYFCLLSNSSACTTGTECKSGVCTGSTCVPCTGDASCSGGAKCNDAFGSKTCSLPTGAFCYISAYCPPGTTCLGTPLKCQ